MVKGGFVETLTARSLSRILSSIYEEFFFCGS